MRILLPALAVLLLPLAGCLESGRDDGAAPSDDGGEPAALASTFRFRPAVDLGTEIGRGGAGAFGTNCNGQGGNDLGLTDGDCGLGEPTMEVDSRGHVYVSGVCCLTVAPPVLVSRDGGVTFQDLPTPAGVREAFGIEGDFAIDDEGNVYFADIEFAASFQVTVWDPEGAFVRHVKWPAVPIVDRDWIRAEGDGTLYYVYNAVTTGTNVYKSTDGGMTWNPRPLYSASYGLGNAVAGPADGELWVVGGSANGFTTADYTTDGGVTWAEETTTAPSGGNFPVGYFDEAGRMYLSGATDDTISVAVRTPDGDWQPAVDVSGTGHHRMPWLAAGADGAAVVAWYGTNETEIGPATEWFVHVAVTLDAGRTWTTRIADPIPVLVGDLQRQLLDFFQVEVGPDGTIHVAYSSLPVGEEPEEQLHYVRSEPIPQLAPASYFNGP